MKQTKRLTEAKFRRMIQESVRKVINEIMLMDTHPEDGYESQLPVINNKQMYDEIEGSLSKLAPKVARLSSSNGNIVISPSGGRSQIDRVMSQFGYIFNGSDGSALVYRRG